MEVEKKGKPRSYDMLGDIAIVNCNAKTAKIMADEILKSHKNIFTVLRRGGAVNGKFRTRRYIYVKGKRNYIAKYKENGCMFLFDVRKSFFSTRLAFERDRISKLVKDNETIIVMFAGVGPFAIEIAKKHKNAKIIAIELNKEAYIDMLENIKLNKSKNVEAVYGDVHAIAKHYMGIADRIVMPLPMNSFSFLQDAFYTSKKKSIIHYYAFVKSDEGTEKQIQLIENFMLLKGAKIRILDKRRVRTYSANEIEIVLDIQLNKQKNARTFNM
jgi:tRNA (guanine37-N1)-methyltransferase